MASDPTYADPGELAGALGGAVRLEDGRLRVTSEPKLVPALDRLAATAALAPDAELRAVARWLIRAAAADLGVRPASTEALYRARGRGECGGFTVPAVNLRAATYGTARAAFRSARRQEVGALIFELARSEMGYAALRPDEYAAVVLAAALREGHRGAVFLQGDHFQVQPPAYRADREGELGALRELIAEALAAGFLNIDIDASTLVDLSRPSVEEQQAENVAVAAALCQHVRALEPAGITVSIGGEIGEVGGKNSTVEELRAFAGKLAAELGTTAGPVKISVQTGTSHGGVPLPDGRIAQANVDFGVLERLSRVAREEFGMAGAVQHGASTLPEELFTRFPEVETAEIHLATGFQNLILDHPRFPPDLREAMLTWVRETHGASMQPGQTEQQFLYKTRKRALGPFKRELWTLPAEAWSAIAHDLEATFARLFTMLRVGGSAALVERWVDKASPALPSPPEGVREVVPSR